MVTTRHKMILASGRFRGTSREQLTAAFELYSREGAPKPLVIHFHGGLVSEADAERMADRLLPVYESAGGHPFFVIWQAGLGEQLRNNWQEMVTLDVFPLLVERVLQFVIGKLNQRPGEKGFEVEMPSRFTIDDEIVEKQAIDAIPFANRDAEATTLDPKLTPAEDAQFSRMLAADAQLASATLALTSGATPELAPDLETELARAQAVDDPTTKGLVSTALLAQAGLRILGRAVQRLATGRGHGIYTTVVEEVARELKGDLLGGILWKHMKKDTEDSFDGPSETHGGAALLEEINRLAAAGKAQRIVLVGHSTGAVYICHLLQKAVTALAPGVVFDVVFLAPACSFKLLDKTLAAASSRIRWLRSFGMQDELERRDAIFPPIYLNSLLYLVSGLLEEKVDLPLVGMQRYHSGAHPYGPQDFSDIQSARTALEAFTSPWIWSESDLGDGLRSLAHRHGDFDDEESTLKSVGHLIVHGVV